jgi:hypothetical protein
LHGIRFNLRQIAKPKNATIGDSLRSGVRGFAKFRRSERFWPWDLGWWITGQGSLLWAPKENGKRFCAGRMLGVSLVGQISLAEWRILGKIHPKSKYYHL